MFKELAPAITLPASRLSTAEDAGPLGWRLAAPLIVSASIGLWLLVGKAVALIVALTA